LIRALLASLILLFVSITASAHEVRPAYLKLEQTGEQSYDMVWKQPVLSGKRLKLDPILPEACETADGPTSFGSGSLTIRSTLACDLTVGTIGIEGLERTLTDVFVEINYLSGETVRTVLKPSSTTFDIGNTSGAQTSAYLKIGVEHIIFGLDHLLFVIGLVLLVQRRQIIGVATSFTIAHSLTLALAALGLLSIPIRPVEILIAASIVLLAIEIIRKHRGEKSLSTEKPYLIGFLIGLIHGCGFASALSDIGLPKGTELLALLLFNIGVELGQFLVIGAFVIFLALISKMAFNHRHKVEIGITYAIGMIAMFWVIDRLKDYIV